MDSNLIVNAEDALENFTKHDLITNVPIQINDDC